MCKSNCDHPELRPKDGKCSDDLIENVMARMRTTLAMKIMKKIITNSTLKCTESSMSSVHFKS